MEEVAGSIPAGLTKESFDMSKKGHHDPKGRIIDHDCFSDDGRYVLRTTLVGAGNWHTTEIVLAEHFFKEDAAREEEPVRILTNAEIIATAERD